MRYVTGTVEEGNRLPRRLYRRASRDLELTRFG
jgi:hypothetical protein